jgi:hypothetical protein
LFGDFFVLPFSSESFDAEQRTKDNIQRELERERREKEVMTQQIDEERREKEIITQQRDDERREKERLLGLFHLTFSFHF